MWRTNLTLCPFQHPCIIEDTEDSFDENQCHLCKHTFMNLDEVTVHMQTSHLEHFVSMANNLDFQV